MTAIDQTTAAANEAESFDAIIVGAGWAGMYALIKSRELGLRTLVLEAGSGVGGTWYWNRYPGARCDVKSVIYSYSFSPELEQEWTWTEDYATQPEIERYANHVADRFDLIRDIRFDTKVTSATFDEAAASWVIATENGDRMQARYLLLATGGYSQPVFPDIPGVEDFQGESYLTARWPRKPVTFTGKRVGIVGTGASGMQAASAIAAAGVEHLYIFQRTANFAVPARNKPLAAETAAQVKAIYPQLRENARWSGSGAVYDGPRGPVGDLDDDSFRRRMDEAWQVGGPSICGGITDLMTDRRTNQRVADYISDQIAASVADPRIADLVRPSGYTLGARRILVETTYFEALNRADVSLVDARSDPIERITPTGIATAGATYDIDTIVYATGFDSGTGALMQINITGCGGRSLAEHWAQGPVTYLGLMVHGFPNMFTIAGPGSPGIRSNVMVSIEQHVEWIAAFLEFAAGKGIERAEASKVAEQAWTDHVNAVVSKTLLANDDTQYFGSNIPGKARAYLAYIGGVGTYRQICADVAASGYEGITLQGASDLTSNVAWSGPQAHDKALNSRFGATLI